MQSLMFGIYVLTKLGKQFSIDITCFNVVDGLYNCCKLSFMAVGKSCSSEPPGESRDEIQLHWGFSPLFSQ